MMKQWLSFRNICFIIFFFIFILYATRIIDFNPRLLPLIMLVSVYLLTCKNWKIFSKENRENFEESLGTIVIPANLHVKGSLTVDGATKCQDMDTGNIVVANDITAKHANVFSINANNKWHPDIIVNHKLNLNADCNMKTGKNFNHKGDSKSMYGVREGRAQEDDNDGAIGYDPNWGKGLSIVGIKDGGNKRVVRMHTNYLANLNIINTGTLNTATINNSGAITASSLNIDNKLTVGKNDNSAMVLSDGKIGNKRGGQISFESDGWKRCYSWGSGSYNRGIASTQTWTNGHVYAQNITVSDTLKSKNITADWSQGGGGVVRIAKLHVDQLYGIAWGTNSINISNNLAFKTSNRVKLMKFTKAHYGRGADKEQGLVLIDDAELRIDNREETSHYSTHFNHKTMPTKNEGYYGNWIRGKLKY